MLTPTAVPSTRGSLPLLLLLVLVLGCGTQAQPNADTEDAPTATPVEIAVPVTGTARAYLASTASLEAEGEATVVARVGGVVEEIRAEEGQYVERGQPLAQLDDERLRLEMQRADVALQKLSRDLERARTVHEKQLLSQEEYDRIRSDYETQKAATDLVRLELNYTTIRAPISGWVSLRHIKPGNMVQPNEAAFRITDFDPLRAVLHIPERDLAKLAVGQPATLRLDALPNQTFEGAVTLISPVVDPSTGTVKVTVEVQDPSRTAKPGMFGRIQIQHDQRENALLLPKAAVMEEDDRTTVFVVQDSTALRRSITMGYEAGARVEILSGLQTGDSVVVSGQSVLRDSARVAVIP